MTHIRLATDNDIQSKIIYCRGGTKDHTPLVLNTGWQYGLRSDYIPYHDDIAFLDIDYEKGKAAWEYHIQRALEWRPELTMIPDFEEQYSYHELERLHMRLTREGLRTMWTPKFHGCVKDLPEEVVVGVSVPTEHGAFLPRPEDVKGRRLHFLGGDPDAIRYLMDTAYHESIVYSIDTSYFTAQAMKFGKYWSRDGHWTQTENWTYSNNQLIVLSALSIRDYLLADRVPPFNMRREPILRCWRKLNDIADNQLRLPI